MDGYRIYPDPEKTSWPVVLMSLWLRLGVVAVTAVVVALTELYKGEIGILAALAWIFGGAWVAALSWRRAKALLDGADDDVSEAVTSEASAFKVTTHPSWDRREVGAAPAAHEVRG
jgi:hypothetical protein